MPHHCSRARTPTSCGGTGHSTCWSVPECTRYALHLACTGNAATRVRAWANASKSGHCFAHRGSRIYVNHCAHYQQPHCLLHLPVVGTRGARLPDRCAFQVRPIFGRLPLLTRLPGVSTLPVRTLPHQTAAGTTLLRGKQKAYAPPRPCTYRRCWFTPQMLRWWLRSSTYLCNTGILSRADSLPSYWPFSSWPTSSESSTISRVTS